MKKLAVLLFVCLTQAMGSGEIVAQTQVGIPVKEVKSYVLEFNEPFREISVDVLENNFTTEEKIIVKLTPQTKFIGKKGAIEPHLIRRGAQIAISGERLGSALTASEIKVLIDIEKWEVKLKGYFEDLEGDKAWIDGRSVKLAEGVIVKGTNEWKNKTFSSFNEMMLGSEVEVKKGILRPDGIIYATEIETRPNIFTKGDQRLALNVKKGMLIPNGLSGGMGMILGKRVKFVENLALQTYVTKVGYKVIPRYQKDLPKDDPAKITFRFMVIEDESFNAFALPDGSIFIHTGLLRQVQNEAQLAAVLGHEIAHVTHEHSRKQIECWKCDLAALGIVAGGAILGGDVGAAAGQLFAQGLYNSFSRTDENQADRIGLLYMYQAGYDPREAANVWRTIAKETKESKLINFLYSSHPMARERVRNLNRELSYSFYETDFSQVKKGDDEYLKIVGGYFGWTQATPPSQIFQNTGINPPAHSASPNSTALTTTVAVQDAGFPQFFAKFKKAVLTGNRIALKNMMAATFQWANDGQAIRDEALQNMDSMKLWTALKDAMLANPVQCKLLECGNRTGFQVASITKNRIRILFEREANGEWKWSAILEN